MPTSNRHSSKSSTWQSPPWIVEASSGVLGRIDLDPASTAKANKTVHADFFFTKRDNGLKKPWQVAQSDGRRAVPTSIYLNPPGGWHNGDHGDSEIRHWWEKTLIERMQPYFGHMIWLSFSIEALQVTQVDFEYSLLDFPTCILGRRVSFLSPITGKPISDNTHSSSVTYIPGRKDETGRFYGLFKPYGKVVRPSVDIATPLARLPK